MQASIVLTSFFNFKMVDWRNIIFKSSITGPSTLILPSLTSKVEPDSSTRKQDHKSSPQSYKCPVSTATGSHEDLDKSEHEHEAACKQLHWEIDAEHRHERSREHDEHGHSKSRDLHHGHITGDECGPVLKHGRSVDPGTSGEHPRPKEWCTERGRSHKHRCVHTPEHLPPPPFFQSTPVTPCLASIDSLCILSFDMSRGSLPLDRGSMCTEILASSTGFGYTIQCTSAHSHQWTTCECTTGPCHHNIQAD